MPRVGFAVENKVATVNYDYPKLKLKKGEHARILVGLEDPVVEYVHTLRKPKIVDGKPQMFMDERRDGTKFENYKMDFVSRPICLGDAAELEKKGSDPAHCPACKLAKDFPDYAREPQRRYAMHVIRYRTKGGGTEVAVPFSVEVVVWSFTDTIFNKIIDIKSEWGDLRKHDLLLGPCTVEDFQKFDITPASKAEWLADPERQKVTALTFRENQIPDLRIAAGSVKQKQWVEQDVDAIIENWRIVKGVEESTSSTVSLDDDLNSLLSGGTPAAAAAPIKDEEVNLATGELLNELPDAVLNDVLGDVVKEAESVTASPSDDLLDGLAGLGVETPVEAAAPAAEAATDTPAVDNFDDLLAGLV